MGGFLGLTIVYTYAASGEVTELPIDIAWSFTNMWSGLGILCGPFFSGQTQRTITVCLCGSAHAHAHCFLVYMKFNLVPNKL